jgi:hypothetical protein
MRSAAYIIKPLIDIVNFTDVIGFPRIVIKSQARHYNVWEDGGMLVQHTVAYCRGSDMLLSVAESGRAWSLVEEGRYKPAVVECILAAKQAFAGE